ncbi:hypothetical protein HEB94_000901 [Actinopolymorpha pittospori]|uniref:Major Facilitator Superfamily protein n=1 Tax=Actinopolymorpha pittospori TaxID=648752 RepID=A0A927RI06_9ACTN|nr:hypothetical protein [Actinopolymorpha pittospori]
MPVEVSVLFAVYAIGAVIGLPTLGWLSDQIGRRPVLGTALLLAAAAANLFLVSNDLGMTLAARVPSGLAAALATGAGNVGTGEQLPTDRRCADRVEDPIYPDVGVLRAGHDRRHEGPSSGTGRASPSRSRAITSLVQVPIGDQRGADLGASVEDDLVKCVMAHPEPRHQRVQRYAVDHDRDEHPPLV